MIVNSNPLRFIWPWLVGLLVLVLVPLVMSILLSFAEWDGFAESDIRWVGPKHYQRLFEIERSYEITPSDPWYWSVLGGKPAEPRFFTAVYNTLVFTLLAAPLGLIVALLLALLLHQELRGIALFRCAYYVPHLLGGVGTVLMWQWLFHPDAGLVNGVIGELYRGWSWLAGLFGAEVAAWEPPRWLHSPQWCKPALVIMHLWGSGGGMLIFLAALANVPERLHEAARIDGAGAWYRFRHVTLPQISPAILFNLVVGIIGATRIFRDAYILRHWSQDEGLLFYMPYLFENAFEEPTRLGYASALSWVLFAVLFGLTLLTVVAGRRWVHYEN